MTILGDNIRTAANAFLRNYVIDGVSSSRVNSPKKSDGRAAFESVADAVDQAVTLGDSQTITGKKTMSGGVAGLPAPVADGDAIRKQDLDYLAATVTAAANGEVPFATLADMTLGYAAGTFARVYADPTDANNRSYVKSGASGVGSWDVAKDRVDLEAAYRLSADVGAIEAVGLQADQSNLFTAEELSFTDTSRVNGLTYSAAGTRGGKPCFIVTSPAGQFGNAEYRIPVSALGGASEFSASVNIIGADAGVTDTNSGQVQWLIRQIKEDGSEITASRVLTVICGTEGLSDGAHIFTANSIAVDADCATIGFMVRPSNLNGVSARAVGFRDMLLAPGPNPNFRWPYSVPPTPKVYVVSPDGDDVTGTGSISAPLATIPAAIAACKGSGKIFMRAGVYTGSEQTFDPSSVVDLEIAGEELMDGSRPQVVFGQKLTGVTKSSGYTSVYQASVTISQNVTPAWIWQHGVADTSTEISSAERDGRQRGRQYRLPSVCIKRAVAARFNGQISSSTLTVNTLVEGALADDLLVKDQQGTLAADLSIVSQATGTTGGAGTYNLSATATLSSGSGYNMFLDFVDAASACTAIDASVSDGNPTCWYDADNEILYFAIQDGGDATSADVYLSAHAEGLNKAVAAVNFTGSITDDELTIASISGGGNSAKPGQLVQLGASISGTRIVEQLSGTTGGVGVYKVSPSQTIGSTTGSLVKSSQGRIRISGIDQYYGFVDMTFYPSWELHDVTSGGSAVNGFDLGGGGRGKVTDCEAWGGGSGPGQSGGDGFNAHGSGHITTSGVWAHDNHDDGESVHDNIVLLSTGLLSEYNGGCGAIPAYGAQATYWLPVMRKNSQRGRSWKPGGLSATGESAGWTNQTICHVYGGTSSDEPYGFSDDTILTGGSATLIAHDCVATNSSIFGFSCAVALDCRYAGTGTAKASGTSITPASSALS